MLVSVLKKLVVFVVLFAAIGLFIFPVQAAPATPSGFSQESSTETSVTVKWNKVSGANEYQVFYRTQGSDPDSTTDNIVKDSVGDVDRREVGNLKSNTIYRMWINACDSSGCSDPSSEVEVRTGSSVTNSTASLSNNQLPIALGGQPVSTENYRAPQHSDYSISNIQHGLLCTLAGMSPVGQCIAVGPRGQAFLFDKLPSGGAIGGLGTMTAMLYNQKPTSSAEYLASVGNGLGVISPAFAQVSGSGDSVIKPVLLLWQVMRNLAYVVMIIVFMVIGFMIMFRSKINPQTVISIQSALPGLVIGLVLITFSYFLSALIVDMAFLGMGLVAQVFLQVINPADGRVLNVFNPTELANNANLFDLFASSAFRFQNIGDVMGPTFDTQKSVGLLGFLIPIVVGGVIGTFLLPGAGTLLGLGWGTAIGGGVGIGLPLIVGLLLPLVLIIALIIQFFKLFFKLLNSYIMILVTTILGPMFILVGTIPGQNKTTAFWWRNLLGHALVFPAVFAVFLFAGMILATPVWESTVPLFGGLSTALIRVFVAYGIILGLPAVPDVIKKLVGAQDLGAIGTEGTKGFIGAGSIFGKAAGAGFNRTPIAAGMRMRKMLREAEEKEAAGIDIHDEAPRLRARINRLRQERGFGPQIVASAASPFRVTPGNANLRHERDFEYRIKYRLADANEINNWIGNSPERYDQVHRWLGVHNYNPQGVRNNRP